ncbi:Gp37-like protein [Mycobacteroides immunogenum]|nr:hypothetical protein [Mycobacteroides immunogenum]
MTIIDDIYRGAEGLIDVPLEFTRNIGGNLQSALIGALAAPLPASDPMAAYRYLSGRRDIIAGAGKQRPLIRLQDKNLEHLAVIGSEVSCSMEEVATESGSATVVLRGGDYLADFVRKAVRLDEDLHLSIDPIPSRPSWKTRWGGKITRINAKRNSSGIHTVELQATSNREHLKTLLVGATPVSPPEFQPLKMWFLPGNTRTICAATLAINLARLFSQPLSFITNILNPAGWFQGGISNIDPLSWPLQVQFVNPLLDQSRTSMLMGSWTDFHSATAELLRDAGVIARAYTFFTEDEENPHPELEALAGGVADLARPHRNCVVFAFEDKSGYEGPTGTAIDGVINLFASTADDLITETVFPIDTDDDGEVDPLFRRILGVAPKKPWAIFWESQHSGIVDSGYYQHKGPVLTAMTGGHSPRIVNELQTFGIRYGLAKLSEVIPLPGTATQAPGSNGLENLYQGQFDDMLFAHMRFTDPKRRAMTGDLAYQELYERGTAYVASALLVLRQLNWKRRAYRSFKTSIRNGAPYVINEDILLGDRVGFEQDGILYVDQVFAIKYEYDRSRPVTYSVSVGDDRKEDDPLSQGLRALQGVASMVSMALGNGSVLG